MGFNFRDLGPLEVSGLLRMPAGQLFRSGCPGMTSVEEFVETIRVHGIRSIVDLRCSGERTEIPAYYQPLENVEIVNLPFLATIRKEWVHPLSQDPLSTAKRYLGMIEASGGAFVSILEWLTRADGSPTLIHCAAGRDRTGMVCTLLLGALGVGRTTIAADYALSDREVDDGSRAWPETIFQLLGLVDDTYGTLGALLERLGVQGDLRLAWEARYR